MSQFQCKWLACSIGDICRDFYPAGDGCYEARCDPLPVECAGDPTCACVALYIVDGSCSEDDAGNITIVGTNF
jgi:hypothetical protein